MVKKWEKLTKEETDLLSQALDQFASKVGEEKVLSLDPYVVHEKIQEMVHADSGRYIPMVAVVTFPIHF